MTPFRCYDVGISSVLDKKKKVWSYAGSCLQDRKPKLLDFKPPAIYIPELATLRQFAMLLHASGVGEYLVKL